MLIKVFDSEWFDPNGIRLELVGAGYPWPEVDCTRVIFGTYSIKDEYRDRSVPSPEYRTAYNCIFIEGKTPDEVAAEINQQLDKDK